MKDIKIGNYLIGENHPPFVIAELSGNHNGSIEQAKKIISAAAEAGSHAVKFQTYTADTMTLDLRAPGFVIDDPKSLWHERSLYDLYDEAHTPWEWHEELFSHARSMGLIPLSTPFDETAVDFLETLGCEIYKIASFENTDYDLIEKVISTGKPILISTGMMSISELEELKLLFNSNKFNDVVLLKCTSNYPADPVDANLNTIPHMRDLMGVNVGLSDHTLGNGVAVASVAYGVRVIEKHVTLDRSEGGVDSAFSLEPAELKNLVDETKRAFVAQGVVKYSGTSNEHASKQFRRSLYFVKSASAGQVISNDMLRAIRPGFGLPVKHRKSLIGKVLAKDVSPGTAVDFSYIN